MTFESRLSRIADALTSINGIPVYHYWRPAADLKYILWEEDGEASSLEADNRKREQALAGVVDYYTVDEFDPVADEIQEKLNGVEGLYWSYDGVTFEDDTNYIHHTWRWSLL